MSRFKVGDFLFDSVSGLVIREKTTVTLQPRCRRLLSYLIEHSDRVVSRTELIEKIWDGQIVTEDALNNSVRKLRKAFADDHRQPRVIQTLPGKGYQLIASVNLIQPGRFLERFMVRFLVLSTLGVLALLYLFFSIDVYVFSEGEPQHLRQQRITQLSDSLLNKPEAHVMRVSVGEDENSTTESSFQD